MIRRFVTLGSGEAIARALFLAAFVLLARGLGKEDLGQFGFALSVVSYLVLTVQQGFDQIAVRALTHSPEMLGRYVRGLLGLRLFLAAAVYAALLLFITANSNQSKQYELLLILGLTCFTAAASPRWAFQIISPFRYSIASVLSQLVFCLGAVAVWSGLGVYSAAAFFVAGDILAALYLLTAIRVQCKITPSYSPTFWRELALESWPLSLSSFLGILVYNFDVLALGWLANPAETGLYLASYRCATVFSPMLSILQLSILPDYARAYPDRTRLSAGLKMVAIPSVIFAIAIAIVFSLFPAQILRIVYGNGYTSGAVLLRVLAWSLPLQALRSIFRQSLIAASLQRWDTVNMVCAAATSISIDLALIPRIGPLACAIATAGSELVLFVMSSAVIRTKIFGGNAFPVSKLEERD